MRKPLKGGAVIAQPKMVRSRPPKSVRRRRIAGLCIGVASVVTAGILSSMFVGYLADRALLRAANAPRAVAVADAAATAQISPPSEQVAAAPVIEGIPVKMQPPPAAKVQAARPVDATKPSAVEEADADLVDEASGDELAFADGKPAARKPPEIIQQENPADGTYTGAIPTARPEPEAPAAKAVKTSTAEPEPVIESEPLPADGAKAAAGQNARVNRSVTMRSGPEKGAGAIGTIPGKASITLVSCKSWCEVVYKGKRGFIYKGFVDRS